MQQSALQDKHASWEHLPDCNSYSVPILEVKSYLLKNPNECVIIVITVLEATTEALICPTRLQHKSKCI